MKIRSLLLAATFLGLASPAFAAPAHVQSYANQLSASGTSYAFQLSSAVGGGDAFAGMFYLTNSSNSISTIKDDKGDVATLLDSHQDGSIEGYVQSFAFTNMTAGAQTITVTLSATPTSGGTEFLWGDEYSGVGGVDTHSMVDTTSGTSWPTGAVTLAHAGEQLWTGMAPDSATPTVPSGYTARENTDGLFAGDLVASASGSYGAVDWTGSTSSNAVVGLIAFAPPPASIDMSDSSHIAPGANGSFLGVVNGAWAGGQTGPVGPAGAAGTNGNTVRNGTGAPAASTGANGDFYIDTQADSIYGPKASGAWPSSGVSLVGAQGPAGQNAGQNTYPACPAHTDTATVGESEFCQGPTGNTDIAVAPAANTWVYFGPAAQSAP